jgi:hypothetical protein
MSGLVIDDVPLEAPKGIGLWLFVSQGPPSGVTMRHHPFIVTVDVDRTVRRNMPREGGPKYQLYHQSTKDLSLIIVGGQGVLRDRAFGPLSRLRAIDDERGRTHLFVNVLHVGAIMHHNERAKAQAASYPLAVIITHKRCPQALIGKRP